MAAKINYSLVKTILKSATYAIVGTASTLIVTGIQGGMSYKTAIITGVATGLIAGIKNVLKAGFNLDLDLSTLKK